MSEAPADTTAGAATSATARSDGGRDPLSALRAADSRPLTVQFRDRVRRELGSRLTAGPALLFAVATAVVLSFVAWRLTLDAQPPVEHSIPLAAAPPPAEPDAPAPAPTVPAELVVHVAGAVLRPGLVAGESGWRVADAVAAAGGVTADADTDRLNLARILDDGERVYVPVEGESVPTIVGNDGTAVVGLATPVDLNTASAAELEQLPGVGPATAAAIIEHRESHGSFGTIDALVAVRGIGPATLERLRSHVTVG